MQHGDPLPSAWPADGAHETAYPRDTYLGSVSVSCGTWSLRGFMPRSGFAGRGGCFADPCPTRAPPRFPQRHAMSRGPAREVNKCERRFFKFGAK